MSSSLRHILFVILLVTLCGCSAGSAEPEAAPLRVQYTAAARAWLADVQACAGERPLLAEPASPSAIDPQEFDLAFSLGAAPAPYPAYEIGEETIHVIVSSQNPVGVLTDRQAAGIFSGTIGSWDELGEAGGAIRVWAYPAGEDVQAVFERALLSGGTPVAGSSLAMDPEAMRAAVASDPAAIGILPGEWLTGDVRTVLEVVSVPVLVSTALEADETSLAIIACLQAR